MSEISLYVVATPIGNLDDVSLRTRNILEKVPLIAAEDTRRAKKLLTHLHLDKKEVLSYYDQVELAKAPSLIQRMLETQQSMALISDAGTPCVSDPGYRLVAEAHKQGVNVVPVPGASALTSLVSVSGLPSHRFQFIGFLPSKDGALKTEVESWRRYPGSVIFYESARRIKKSLNTIARYHPNAQVCLGRELTKIHEEVKLFSIEESIQWCQEHESMKGELVVMMAGFAGDEEVNQGDLSGLETLLRDDIAAGKRSKEILKTHKDCGLSRQELYQLILKLKGETRQLPLPEGRGLEGDF